jgi:ribosomal protein S18 acetylase RimI-like enzyme
VVVVRTAVEADAAAVVDLWRREGGPTRSVNRVDDALALMRRDPDALLVAVEGDDIVGTLIVGWDGWRCHLYRLAVEPAVRRRGIARMLVDAALRRGAQVGAERIDASVDRDNADAIAFWSSVGFAFDAHAARYLCAVAPRG